ncbi:MAG: hypothetical protein K9M15_01705 [Candidatus Marinimicrobia bacterium]|nr:hypothetical protein [Candidatus Neomarinimicrobiota bacterium]
MPLKLFAAVTSVQIRRVRFRINILNLVRIVPDTRLTAHSIVAPNKAEAEVQALKELGRSVPPTAFWDKNRIAYVSEIPMDLVKKTQSTGELYVLAFLAEKDSLRKVRGRIKVKASFYISEWFTTAKDRKEAEKKGMEKLLATCPKSAKWKNHIVVAANVLPYAYNKIFNPKLWEK